MRIDDGETVLKRWIGQVAAAAAMLVMVSPAVARADFDEVACMAVTGETTRIAAAGPGLVAVDGRVKPRDGDVGTCDAAATLIVFGEQRDGSHPSYARRVLGTTTVPGQDGLFTQALDVSSATYAICLTGNGVGLIDCQQVTVPGRRDASGNASAGVPIVGGRIDPAELVLPAPPPCGHCM